MFKFRRTINENRHRIHKLRTGKAGEGEAACGICGGNTEDRSRTVI